MKGMDLGDGLVLRSLEDARDAERFAEFNGTYNFPNEGATCRCLLGHLPDRSYSDYQVVEDTATGEIVSTTCLIPWTMSFGGVSLRAAQLEMVLTHPDYRQRRLVKTQMQHFEERVSKGGYDLSIIWGIPNYYRQYGYAYLVEGGSADTLPAWRIPDAPKEQALCILEKAGSGDIPYLMEQYSSAMKEMDIHILKSPEFWRYQIEAAQFPVWLVKRPRSEKPLGYIIQPYKEGSETAFITEDSVADAETALLLLQTLKAKGYKEINIAWPKERVLVSLARSLGSIPDLGEQWLIRIPDLASFLQKAGPVLNYNLAQSDWAGFTGSLCINLYKTAYRISFEGGRLTQTENLGFRNASMGADGGDLCIPSDAFLRLLFGFRSLNALYDAWPDIIVKAEKKSLIQSLFPQKRSYINTPYYFMGKV